LGFRISRVEVVTFSANLLISPATTPKRSQYFPALEASKAALKAIIFVCSAMSLMIFMTRVISFDFFSSWTISATLVSSSALI
jgi:hypothetical protein